MSRPSSEDLKEREDVLVSTIRMVPSGRNIWSELLTFIWFDVYQLTGGLLPNFVFCPDRSDKPKRIDTGSRSVRMVQSFPLIT